MNPNIEINARRAKLGGNSACTRNAPETHSITESAREKSAQQRSIPPDHHPSSGACSIDSIPRMPIHWRRFPSVENSSLLAVARLSVALYTLAVQTVWCGVCCVRERATHTTLLTAVPVSFSSTPSSRRRNIYVTPQSLHTERARAVAGCNSERAHFVFEQSVFESETSRTRGKFRKLPLS